MRRFLPSILVVAGLIVVIGVTALMPHRANTLAGHEPPTDDWTVVQGAGFTARLPGTPEHLEGTSSDGQPVERYTVQSPTDAVSVGSGTLPNGTPRRLSAVVTRLAQAADLPVAESHLTTLAGVAARSYRLTGQANGSGTTIFGTVALQGGRFVTVTYVVKQQGVATAPKVYDDVVAGVDLSR